MSSHNESKSPVAEGSSTPPIDVQMFNQDIAVQNRGAKTEVDTNPPYRAIKSYITDLVEFQTRLQARGHSQNELEQINKEFETYPKAQESLGVSQSRMSSFFQGSWMPRPRLPSPAGLGPSTPFQPPDSDSSTPNFRVSVGSPTEPKPQSTGLSSSNFDFALSARSLFPASRRSPSKPKTTNSGSPQALEDLPDPTDIQSQRNPTSRW